MKYLHIFLLHSQRVFEQRMKSFIWFLAVLLNPLLILLLWKTAFKIPTQNSADWNLSSATTYYFLLVIASGLLMPHVEEEVGKVDIQEGEMTKYLMKPFSYYWFKYYDEISYRLLQGIYGVIVCVLFSFFLGEFIRLETSPLIIGLSTVCAILAYHIAFNFKIVLGLLAFWTTEIVAIFNLAEIIILIFAGFTMPIYLFPTAIANINYFLPFPYMIYFPVIAFQGRLTITELLHIIYIQIIWIIALTILYRWVWSHGIKKFTSFGH